jgi:hypothetical protein
MQGRLARIVTPELEKELQLRRKQARAAALQNVPNQVSVPNVHLNGDSKRTRSNSSPSPALNQPRGIPKVATPNSSTAGGAKQVPARGALIKSQSQRQVQPPVTSRITTASNSSTPAVFTRPPKEARPHSAKKATKCEPAPAASGQARRNSFGQGARLRAQSENKQGNTPTTPTSSIPTPAAAASPVSTGAVHAHTHTHTPDAHKPRSRSPPRRGSKELEIANRAAQVYTSARTAQQAAPAKKPISTPAKTPAKVEKDPSLTQDRAAQGKADKVSHRSLLWHAYLSYMCLFNGCADVHRGMVQSAKTESLEQCRIVARLSG